MTEYGDIPVGFKSLMSQAQFDYSDGRIDDARVQYEQAYNLAMAQEPPYLLGGTRAARGVAESCDRLGERERIDEWVEKTERALFGLEPRALGEMGHTLGGLLELRRSERPSLPDEAREAVRESIQTHTVLGKLMLRKFIAAEAAGGDRPNNRDTVWALVHFGEAAKRLPLVEDHKIDQYRINLAPIAAMGHRLYGSRLRAARWTLQALRYARMSESRSLPTAAFLGEEHRRQAVHRATRRAQGALASLALPRSVALHIAQRAV